MSDNDSILDLFPPFLFDNDTSPSIYPNSNLTNEGNFENYSLPSDQAVTVINSNIPTIIKLDREETPFSTQVDENEYDQPMAQNEIRLLRNNSNRLVESDFSNLTETYFPTQVNESNDDRTFESFDYMINNITGKNVIEIKEKTATSEALKNRTAINDQNYCRRDMQMKSEIEMRHKETKNLNSKLKKVNNVYKAIPKNADASQISVEIEANQNGPFDHIMVKINFRKQFFVY